MTTQPLSTAPMSADDALAALQERYPSRTDYSAELKRTTGRFESVQPDGTAIRTICYVIVHPGFGGEVCDLATGSSFEEALENAQTEWLTTGAE